jgi:hypothetical protein
MNEILYNALEDALTELESGVELEDLLEANPELESDLGLLLETAQKTRREASREIAPEVYNRSRTRVLSRGIQLQQKTRTGLGFLRRTHRLAIALITAAVILLSGGGIAAGSAQALPGDQLYPVKRAAENLRLSLAVTLKDHQTVEDRYQARRIDEVEQLLALGRSAFVEFHGRVNSRDGERWDIGGIKVRQNTQTILIGQIFQGLAVEVEGITIPEGWVLASEIHLQTFGFVGYVEAISPDVWQIAGRTVQISDQTQSDPRIQVGDWVVVSVLSDDFGNLFALIIDTSTLPTPTSGPPALKLTLTAVPGQVEEPGDGDEIVKTEAAMDRDGTDDSEQESKPDDSDGEDKEDGKDGESESADDSPEDSHDEEDESDEEESEEEEEDGEKEDDEDDSP